MVREAALVAQRCMEAQESGVIDLSGCGLMSIPDALYLFLKNYQVNKIDISNNQLKRIPAKLANAFPLVKELIVSNNLDISSLPQEFVNCEQLSLLDLSGNKFTELPPLSFKSLNALNISGNLLENVSDVEISVLSQIKKVDLTENKLSEDTKTKLKNYPNVLI